MITIWLVPGACIILYLAFLAFRRARALERKIQDHLAEQDGPVRNPYANMASMYEIAEKAKKIKPPKA